MRASRLSPALTGWLVLLSALAVLCLGILSAVSLSRVGVKFSPYKTIQLAGVQDEQLAHDLAERFHEIQPIQDVQLTRLTWFLQQCGTTVVRGTLAGGGDEPKSADELVFLACGMDPDRNTRWYELTTGLIEIGATGPAFYPEYGQWSVQYQERPAPQQQSIRIRKEPILAIRYGGLPHGITLWTQQPGPGGAVSWDKHVAPWRVSEPVLFALVATIFTGLGLGFVGIGAWRRGAAYIGGAWVITVWTAALLGTWIVAIFNVRAVETFVDVLQNSRPGVTHLPWILGYAIAGMVFAVSYWAHLSVTREPMPTT
jgi:hypothetical protein